MKAKHLALGLFLFTLALHAAGAASLPLLDRDEPRFAEASREMRERSDYVIPYFNNKERFEKPPFIYWCQIACYTALGESDFAARFPSVLAAALTALVIFGFARRLYDGKAALWAALAFSLSLHTFLLAKAAVADMLMTLFFTLTAWAGWELIREREQPLPPFLLSKWWYIFYASLALGFLAKGPVAWIPLLALLIYAKWTGTGNLNKALRCEIGIPYALFLIGLWGIPAILESKGEFFRVGIGVHVFQRSIDVMQGHGGEGLLSYVALLPFYFVTIFVSFFPWSFSIPSVFRNLKRNENRTPREIYLLCVILPVFAIFTLLKTKLPHYTFPAIPTLSILLGGFWSKTNTPKKSLLVLAGFMTALGFVFSLVALPLALRYFPVSQLLQKSRSWLKPEMEFASTGFNEPSLVWYFRSKVKGFHRSLAGSKETMEFMNQKGRRFAILTEKSFEEIASAMNPEWKILSAEGINPAKGKWVSLKMVIKTN